MPEDDVKKTLLGAAVSLTKDIYDDTLKPSMQNVGLSLAAIVGVVNSILTPVTYANDYFKFVAENNKAKLNKRLLEIDSSEFVEILPDIAVPIINQLSYTSTNEISDLFIELLASAGSKNKSEFVHPSFIYMISNLSPDEAKVLKFIKDENGLLTSKFGLYSPDNQTYTDHGLNSSILNFSRLLSLPDYASTALNNLQRLGLIQHYAIPTNRKDFKLIHDSLKDKFKEVIASKPGYDIRFSNSFINFTDLGNLFVKSVIT